MAGMKIVLNGKTREMSGQTTVRELLEASGLGHAPCAVEINEKLVTRAEHECYHLQDGDRVEVVTLVGGG